jgi:hypothetical protein
MSHDVDEIAQAQADARQRWIGLRAAVSAALDLADTYAEDGAPVTACDRLMRVCADLAGGNLSAYVIEFTYEDDIPVGPTVAVVNARDAADAELRWRASTGGVGIQNAQVRSVRRLDYDVVLADRSPRQVPEGSR